jgi:hypothetical protein
MDRLVKAQGRGLYLDALIEKGSEIKIIFDKGSSPAVNARKVGSNSQISFKEVSSITLKNDDGPIHLLMRQPTVSIDGTIELEDFEAARLTGISGQDVTLQGNMSAHLLASDVYAAADRPDFEKGIFPSSERFNELSLLLGSIFLFYRRIF